MILLAALLASQLAPNGLGGYSATLPATKGFSHVFSTGDKISVEAIVNPNTKPPSGTDANGNPLPKSRISSLLKRAGGNAKRDGVDSRLIELKYNSKRVAVRPILENYFLVRNDPIFVCRTYPPTEHVKLEIALVAPKLAKVESFTLATKSTKAGWKLSVEKVLEFKNRVHKGFINQDYQIKLELPVSDYKAGLSIKTQEPDKFLESLESCFLTEGRAKNVVGNTAYVEFFVIRSAKEGVEPEFTLYDVQDERTELWIPVKK